MKPEGSKRPVKSIFGFSIASLILFFLAGTVGLSNEVVNQQVLSLSSNETSKLTDSRSEFSQKTSEFVFEIPADTPNSKLLEIGNSKESLSIFKVGNQANLVFTGQGKNSKEFVSDPLGVPMDFDGQNYSVSMLVKEPSGVVSLTTSNLVYSWKIPSNIGFSVVDYIKSGGITKYKVQLTTVDYLNKRLLLSILFLLECILILFTLRKKIYNFFNYKPPTHKHGLLQTKRIHYALLAFGLVGLVLLPSAPPSGLLSSGSIDLSKVTNSDLVLENKEHNGGWLFKNSPDVTYNSVDYSTTLEFEIDVYLDAESNSTELFAYGIPVGDYDSPESKNNFEVIMNSKERIYFKLPSKDGLGNFNTKNLAKGRHVLSGQIRNSREFEFQIDGTLVYAMSSEDPIYLPIEPNLFIGEYVLDNAKSGKISWEVRAEAATPVKFALHRLQVFITIAAIFSSVFLFGLRILRRGKIKPFADINSRKVLRSSIFTFLVLSTLGCAIWVMAIQPVASISQPRNYPLFLTQYRFSDFYQIFLSSQNKDPYSIAEVIYPPFGMLVLDLGGFMSARQSLMLTMTTALAICASLFLFLASTRNDLSRRETLGVLSVTVLSFPFVFALDRGNLDLVISTFLLLALWFNSKQDKSIAAGVLIGLASAVKIYPLLLLPIFYYQKRAIRTGVTSIVTFLLLSAVGAVHYHIGPMKFLNSVLLGSSGQELSAENALRWNGSFAALITTATNLVSPVSTNDMWNVMSSTISLIVILVIGLVIALWLAKKAVDIPSFAIVWLSVVSLAFPVSGSYRFTIFCLAFALLLINGMQNNRNLNVLGMLLGVTVSPVVYWYFDNGAVSTYSLIVPIATIAMILVIITSTRKKKKHKIKRKVLNRL